MDRSNYQSVGRTGEWLARLWVSRHKGKVLRHNWAPDGGGEIDIIYRDGDVLVFCEVKSRTRVDYGLPRRAVNEKKRRLIRRGARYWLRKLQKDVPYRFDIIEVIFLENQKPQINRIISAFD